MSMPGRALRRVTAVVVAAVVISAGTADVAAPIATISTSATGGAPATAVFHPVDLVSVYERIQLTDNVRDLAIGAADAVHAASTVARGFTIGLNAVHHGAATVQQASGPGVYTWQFPMNVTALPVEVLGSVFGRGVSGPIASGQIVMSQASATLRGAQLGDTVDLVSASGAFTTYTIGAITPDDGLGGAELVMSIDQANELGATVPTKVLIYGQLDHVALDDALAARAILGSATVRVRHSWDPPDPDITLSVIETKVLLGEFDYEVGPGDSMTIDAGWTAANVPARELYSGVGVRAACHRTIHADLQAALTDVANAGLGGEIDLANTNTYGGCFGVRFSRAAQSIGSVSRHAWAMAIDMNTVSNCQGCVPRMNCDIVRIFRKHNFAWGGNFLFPDGMHFEWVGERRDQLQYPSKYCPNLPAFGANAPPQTIRAKFFADDASATLPNE